jgi:V/A-type H+-transporting ATPase subunit K
MRLNKLAVGVLIFNVLAMGLAVYGLAAAAAEEEAAAEVGWAEGLRGLGAGLAFLGGAIGTGVAQSRIGAAAIGAIAEDRANFPFGLIFIAIPETVVIFGLVAIFLI